MKRSGPELAALLLTASLWPAVASATSLPVPEPEIWSLLGIAAVAGAVITFRRRR
jgi:hypothetical protein